jgi:ribonuclease-3
MTTIDRKIVEAERILNYVFADKSLCVEAIQMAAPEVVVNFNGGRSIIQSNKRLAVLGDSVLSLELCKKWYQAGIDHSLSTALS